jgi:hypothetical protein
MNGDIMKPHGAAALIVAALLLLPMAALAADSSIKSEPSSSGSPAAGDTSADEASSNPFLPGEQLLGLAVGLQIPAFLEPQTGFGVGNLDLGISFSFSYQYFVATGVSIGGNIAGAFNNTIGGLSVFTAPLGFTTSYWWTKLPFEFTVLGEVGGYIVRYNNEGMIDPFAKAGGGVYWRATASWSLGLQAYLWFVPEIHYGEFSYLSQYAGFIETSITAIYHL